MDGLEALRLQVEWGADDALEAAPVDRFAVAATPPSGAPPRQADAAPALPRPPPRPVLLPGFGVAPGTPAARAQDVAGAAGSRDELRAALAGFEGCALRATATNLVFADGDPDAGLMFVGEAPGVEEDRSGLPFVGISGKFFDRMVGSIGLDRSRFLITNLIPWRPPGNRAPTENEILICLPFLLRHVALARPRHLVLLGGMATRAVLGGTTGIRRLRGRWQQAAIPGLDAPVPTLPMLHPAYLLRTPGAKRDAWSDLLLLRRTLDDG